MTGLTQPDPLPEEESASIMLGWVDEGSGDDDPSPVQQEQEDIVPPANTEPEPVVEQEVLQEEVATQDESAIAVTKPKETTKPKPNKPKVDPPKEQPKPDPKPSEDLQNALNDMWSTPSGGGTKGDADKPGSAGKEDGSPSGKGVFGTGGNSWSLSGRNYLGGAIVTEKPKEDGIIVIEIVVGTNGRVIDARYKPRGSTSTSMHLINLAKKAAKAAKFNVDPSSSVQQKGTLTFNFQLK